jgi:SMODS-associated and fused to various effectors sensor domain
MAANDLQVVVVVDIYPGVSLDELKAMLPVEREERKVLQLSKLGAPMLEPPPKTTAVDWSAIGMAVEEVAKQVHELQEAHSGPMILYVAGKGPLAVFVHLGYLFTKSIAKVEVFNLPHGSGTWERFSMDAPPSDLETPRMFDKPLGIPKDISMANGRLGLVVDTSGRPDELAPIARFFDEQREPVGETIRLRSYDKMTITAMNIPAIVREFAQFMSEVPNLFPNRKGLALFAAVPTQVAFALGRAMSPNVLRGDVWLTEYRNGSYEKIYSLPFTPPIEPEVPKTAQAILARRDVLDQVIGAFEDLQKHLEVDHVPEGLLRGTERDKFVALVKEMELVRESIEEQPFQLRVLRGKCHLGNGILEAIVKMPPEQQQDFAKLVMLHELVHDTQNLRSTNHSLVGIAGFVLEEVDYMADAFAVQTLARMEMAMNKRERTNASKAVSRWINMVLRGIQAFDEMEQRGDRITHLTERRLRRYLLWDLQAARAMTIKEPADADEMLSSALAVELAPLAGWLHPTRHEKVVKHALGKTELFIAVNGRLVRPSSLPGYTVQDLVEMVRTYKHADVQEVMYAVVDGDGNREKLVPWVNRK